MCPLKQVQREHRKIKHIKSIKTHHHYQQLSYLKYQTTYFMIQLKKKNKCLPWVRDINLHLVFACSGSEHKLTWPTRHYTKGGGIMDIIGGPPIGGAGNIPGCGGPPIMIREMILCLHFTLPGSLRIRILSWLCDLKPLNHWDISDPMIRQSRQDKLCSLTDIWTRDEDSTRGRHTGEQCGWDLP